MVISLLHVDRPDVYGGMSCIAWFRGSEIALQCPICGKLSTVEPAVPVE